MSDDRKVAVAARVAVEQARRDFHLLGLSIDPTIEPRRADDLFQAVASLAVGHVPGVDRDTAALRRQLGDLARGWLASLRPA